MPPKTVIEKVQSPRPNITVFKISGTLGFHEKVTLEKLFQECKKRSLSRIVLDVEAITSLGGGCAQIIRDEAAGGDVALAIAGAKSTVLKFLGKQKIPELIITSTVDEAYDRVDAAPISEAAPASDIDTESDDDLVSEESLNAVLGDETEDRAQDAHDESSTDPSPKPAPTEPTIEFADDSEPVVTSREEQPSVDQAAAPSDLESTEAKTLQKRIVQYNTLFSINSEFARIGDRRKLLDLFLLTTIAQVGVESAIFMENNQGYFVPAANKGIEVDDLRGFALAAEQLCLEEWKETGEVYSLESAPFGDDVKAPLLSLGIAYVAPVVAQGEFRGVVLLGPPIKRAVDETTIEFLKILINQVAIAFENLSRFEVENERTLGLVQTLIAMIEDNTLARGSTEMLSSYVYALAQRIHYPEEHMRDLMYGTVLRDIGMIKVSDLIVRSPRELLPEEWEVIKRHPIDGANMLRDMKFSERATNIVLCHHERFNGEGYPNGLHGQDIPIGARIVSVVESYAAMLQERPTRPALSPEEALNTLKENWGMRYDADVVKGFVEIIEEEMRSGDRVVDRKFELFSV